MLKYTVQKEDLWTTITLYDTTTNGARIAFIKSFDGCPYWLGYSFCRNRDVPLQFNAENIIEAKIKLNKWLRNEISNILNENLFQNSTDILKTFRDNLPTNDAIRKGEA